jgi:hypothetical protein
MLSEKLWNCFIRSCSKLGLPENSSLSYKLIIEFIVKVFK